MNDESIAITVVGGFNIIIQLNIDLSKYRPHEIEKWEMIFLFNRIITYSHILKVISDYCSMGDWYIRIRFYEQWDNPMDMYIKIIDGRRFILLNSVPEPSRLIVKFVHNPRFSNAAVLIMKPKDTVDIPRWIYELEKIARKLYLELSPIMYARGLGRLIGIKVKRDKEKGLSVNLCIDKELPSKQRIIEKGLEIILSSIRKCIE